MARRSEQPFWQELDLSRQRGPRYRLLAGAIERGIEQGQLSAGSKLPPQRDLAFDLGVTVGTVGRAYDLLVRQGRLRGEIGRGTFVCGPDRLDWPGHIDQSSGGLNLTVNMPITTAAMTEMAHIMAEVMTSAEARAMVGRYPPIHGHQPARHTATDWLASQGVHTSPEQVLFTAGAQAGIAASLVAIARPSEGILLEALTFARFATLTRTLGMRAEGVAIDAEGMIPEALDAACRQGRGRVLILSPAMNNPTGVMLTESRRHALVEIARLHDLLVIEDDVYGMLIENGPPKLQSLMPERTIYITSLSKFIAPGLRTGIIAAPARLSDLIVAKLGDLTIAAPALAGLAMTEAWQQGLLARAEVLQRQAIADRQHLARKHLAGINIASPPQTPHLWLCLSDPRQAEDTVLQLAERGIKVAGGRSFAVDPRASVPYIRVSLGPLPEAELARALSTVATLVTSQGMTELAI